MTEEKGAGDKDEEAALPLYTAALPLIPHPA
jgi:hypothetical protein